MSTDLELMVSYDCDAEIFDAMVAEYAFDPTVHLDLDISDDYLCGGWPEPEPVSIRDAIRLITGTSPTEFFTTDQAAELRFMLNNPPPPTILLPTSEYQVVTHG